MRIDELAVLGDHDTILGIGESHDLGIGRAVPEWQLARMDDVVTEISEN